ncbi:MAG TPA: hypothetical protein PKO15_13970 [Fibrobacteria bacterium]|nr:hypothetical protein [Fibrobacteria bacterium]HOX51463.1 hypothetical protein [Fibrobacteria bacterium]
MNIKILLLSATLGGASLAGATDSTTTVRGPNFDPDRHARMTAALEAGDTATVNSIRAEHRAKMQAKRQSMGKDGQGLGTQGRKGQGMGVGNGGHGGKGGMAGKGGHGGQCRGGATGGSN